MHLVRISLIYWTKGFHPLVEKVLLGASREPLACKHLPHCRCLLFSFHLLLQPRSPSTPCCLRAITPGETCACKQGRQEPGLWPWSQSLWPPNQQGSVCAGRGVWPHVLGAEHPPQLVEDPAVPQRVGDGIRVVHARAFLSRATAEKILGLRP